MRKVTDEHVLEVLRAHHLTAADHDARTFELVALAHAGAATAAEAKAAADALRAQPELAETMLALAAIEARGLLAPLVHERRPHVSKSIALALSFAAVIVLLMIFPWSKPVTDELLPKGNAEELALAVERSGHRFTARPGDLLLAGDRLGMFYSAPAPGHLAILYRDQAANVVALYPAGRDASAPIVAGVNVAVPDGAVVEDGSGCAWFVGVFSDEPLPISALSAALGKTDPNGSNCELAVHVPGARSVRVLAVRRP